MMMSRRLHQKQKTVCNDGLLQSVSAYKDIMSNVQRVREEMHSVMDAFTESPSPMLCDELEKLASLHEAFYRDFCNLEDSVLALDAKTNEASFKFNQDIYQKRQSIRSMLTEYFTSSTLVGSN